MCPHTSLNRFCQNWCLVEWGRKWGIIQFSFKINSLALKKKKEKKTQKTPKSTIMVDFKHFKNSLFSSLTDGKVLWTFTLGVCLLPETLSFLMVICKLNMNINIVGLCFIFKYLKINYNFIFYNLWVPTPCRLSWSYSFLAFLFLSFFFLFFFLATPTACESSRARDWSRATTMIYATAGATPDP